MSGLHAPIVLVKMKNGSLQLFVDYLLLNGVSETDAYPFSRVEEVIDCLAKSCFITIMDLTRGY